MYGHCAVLSVRLLGIVGRIRRTVAGKLENVPRQRYKTDDR